MNCMKCGRETQDDTVFCQDCLLEMEKYPVRPGTVVLLPRRREILNQKKQLKRKIPTVEEQNLFLRKVLLILVLLLAISIALIVMMFEPTMHYIRDEHFEIGQNYSTVTQTAPVSTE